ncbi:MAG: hypothetical protein PHQ23_07525 [Candidatus Wallbacteria bacterium]|nr:hypothetical protein [Candidatus Wallbacteria bacterium]
MSDNFRFNGESFVQKFAERCRSRGIRKLILFLIFTSLGWWYFNVHNPMTKRPLLNGTHLDRAQTRACRDTMRNLENILRQYRSVHPDEDMPGIDVLGRFFPGNRLPSCPAAKPGDSYLIVNEAGGWRIRCRYHGTIDE